jgi:hypothetical protein
VAEQASAAGFEIVLEGAGVAQDVLFETDGWVLATGALLGLEAFSAYGAVS